MRYIFWLLIIFNISIFLYFTSFSSDDGRFDQRGRTQGRALVLLQEEEPPPVPRADELPEQPETGALANIDAELEAEPEIPPVIPDPICYSIAPFEAEKDTMAAVKLLSSSKLKVKPEEVVLRIPTGGYWVYLSPFQSRAEAKKIAGELAKKGVADYYILTGGEFKNAISLGLYSGKDFAEKRARIIRGKGYSPVVSPRYRVERHYAVKFLVPPDHEIEVDFMARLSKAADGARQEIIDCVSVQDLLE